MCRHAEIALQPIPASAHRARAFVDARLREWGAAELSETATLAVSELVTNGVLHARTDLEVVVAIAGGVCEVGVSDRDQRLPRPRRRPGDPEPVVDDSPSWVRDGGRGLMLVEALADEWGVAELTAGKQVWFRLSLDAGWRPGASVCPCDRGGTVLALPSGRGVVQAGGDGGRDATGSGDDRQTRRRPAG